MKLTIIGFWGGYPAPDGATSAYLLEKDDFTLLIDIGSGSLSKLQSNKHVMDLDAVILSHYHHDHVADIGVLQYAWLVQSYIQENSEVLPIYGHTEDLDGFNALTHKNTEGIAYDPAAALEVGPFSITFLKTVHPVPCFGMRITDGETTIVYTADTAFKEEWYDFAKDADLLITDCNFYEDQDASAAGHMTSQEGAMVAEEANVNELILSHLPQYRDNNDLVKEAGRYFSGKVQLAKEGLIWEKSRNF
ncbi:MBL fold metallo-hydrolase [Lentibacillus salicampi]|uniref:MBL fold metallo-hydrolase n=1 Tax=Lentibacillus salicampi TaxID=175306 RepID=A0A4Y9ACD0_9BACI|nr:MBL fold metallo-hydrolase [Lentibacillus salicampi]TFJ93549.1 MBL fold metallo-hydrolase [Lentibacillus salicampi]